MIPQGLSYASLGLKFGPQRLKSDDCWSLVEHNAPNMLPIGYSGSSFDGKTNLKPIVVVLHLYGFFVCFCVALSAFSGYIGSSWAPSCSPEVSFGIILELSWAYLGALGGCLGALGGYLGAPWISLGFLWAVLGSIGGLQLQFCHPNDSCGTIVGPSWRILNPLGSFIDLILSIFQHSEPKTSQVPA